MAQAVITPDCHLYRVSDSVTGKFYIGKHKGRVQQGYWGSGIRINRHIKKYGKQNMKYETLVIGSEKYIFDIEKMYLTDDYIKANPDCLNLCKGGVGGNFGGNPWNKGKTGVQTAWNKGIPFSEETKKKLSKAWEKRVISEETKAKMSKSRMGKLPYVMTDEVKSKISNTLKGHTPWNKGKTGVQVSTRKGTKLPDDVRAKISATLKLRALNKRQEQV
jgi:hypothetical protein